MSLNRPDRHNRHSHRLVADLLFPTDVPLNVVQGERGVSDPGLPIPTACEMDQDNTTLKKVIDSQTHIIRALIVALDDQRWKHRVSVELLTAEPFNPM